MRCPYCSAPDSRVVDSRPVEEDQAIRRRRECPICTRRFTTFEKVELVPVLVIKKDGRRQPFDADKLRQGVMSACGKRPVSAAQIDSLVRDVEQQIESRMEAEIPSDDIGEMVMKHLKALDEIAYVRFASVYRQFRDINTFMAELSKLLGESSENRE